MVHTSTEFIADPTGHMLAVIDYWDRAAEAQAALEAAGFEEARVYRGIDGAEAIDSKGTEHGLLEHLVRILQQSLTNKDSLAEYERAVREGASVVSVRVGNEDGLRESALAILERANGRAINYFGPTMVETMRP